MPIYEGPSDPSPRSVARYSVPSTYNTITTEAPAPDKAPDEQQVVVCMGEEQPTDQLNLSFGSTPQLAFLAPVLLLLPYLFDPENSSIPDAQLGLAWTGLIASLLGAGGLLYFAVFVAQIPFEAIDWFGSSFDEPCVHQPDLPRKKCPKRECSQLHRFNNIKFFLTMLVAIYHFWGVCHIRALCVQGKLADYGFWFSAFSGWHEQFVMNTYSFISGILSAPIGGSPHDLRRMDGTVSRVVTLYFVSQFFFVVFVWNISRIFGGSDLYDPDTGLDLVDVSTSTRPVSLINWIMTPYYHLWYLLALAIWRIVAPYWCRLRFPLLWAVMFGVLSGYMGNGPIGNGRVEQTIISIRKIWGFFPFYMLGVVLQPHKYLLMDILDNPRVRLCGVFTLVCSFFLSSYMICGSIDHWDNSCARKYNTFFGYQQPYEKNLSQFAVVLVKEHGSWAGAQVGLYLFSTVMMFSCMALVPNSRISIMTDFGSRSLTNYIYHIPVIFFLGYSGLYQHISKGWDQLVVLLMAVLTSLLLMTPWASYAVSWLIDPPLGRLGLMASSVSKKTDKKKEDNTNTTGIPTRGAWDEPDVESSMQRMHRLVLEYRTPISVACVFVLLTLAMCELKNPWTRYWEDKSLFVNDPYVHLKVFGPASAHCTNWAAYNSTELIEYLYNPTYQQTFQPTGEPTVFPTTSASVNGSF